MDTVQKKHDLNANRLKDFKVKLGEITRERNSLKEMLDHYDTFETKDSHDDQVFHLHLISSLTSHCRENRG